MSKLLTPPRFEKLQLMATSLSEIAAPELGLLPMLSVEDSGIYITRDDEGLVLTYSFQAGEHSREQLEELASLLLKQSLVDDEFLINNGFKREYGARASMKKSAPTSPLTPPVRRE